MVIHVVGGDTHNSKYSRRGMLLLEGSTSDIISFWFRYVIIMWCQVMPCDLAALLQDVITQLNQSSGDHGEEGYVIMLKSIAKNHKLSLGKVMKVCRHVITGGKVWTAPRACVTCVWGNVYTGRTKGGYSNEHNGVRTDQEQNTTICEEFISINIIMTNVNISWLVYMPNFHHLQYMYGVFKTFIEISCSTGWSRYPACCAGTSTKSICSMSGTIFQ